MISTFEKDYEYLMKRWYSLEEKAKNNITLSGVFLGAIFGLVKEPQIKAASLHSILYSVTIILIIFCIIFAWLVIKPSDTALPYLGSKVLLDFDNLCASDTFNEACQVGYFYHKAKKWELVIKKKSDDIKFKADYLRASNAFLFIAIIFFGLFVICYKMVPQA